MPLSFRGGRPRRVTRAEAVAGVVRELEDWAARFAAAAHAGDPARVEAAAAGLVDWLGHDLVDAFRHIDVPTWEALSALAEELFEAFRAVQAGMGLSPGPSWPGLPAAAGGFEAILRKARAIRDA